jgi:drug/metabolite transporter (DMT)-like permease
MADPSGDVFAPISYGLFSVFLWSLSASIADFLTGDANYLAFTLGILVCGLVFFGADSYRKRNRLIAEYKSLSKREKSIFLISVLLFGILLIIYDMAFYFSIQAGPSIPANLINYLWPVLTPVLAVYLFQRPDDQITLYELAALLLAFIGAIIAVGNLPISLSLSVSGFRVSYVAALVAAISAAVYLNALDIAQDYISSISLTYFLGILFALPFLLISIPLMGLSWQLTTDSIPLILLYGLVGFAGGQLAWGRAITRGNKIVISGLAYLTPILSTLFLFIFVDANLTESMAAGGVLIVISNVLLNDTFRHISSIRGAIIGVFTVSIIIFVDPVIGGQEGSIGAAEGVVATIFAILSGFMLDRVWQMNKSENNSLTEVNNTLERFEPLVNDIPEEQQNMVITKIDELMTSILKLNYSKKDSNRYTLSREIYDDLNNFQDTVSEVFAGTDHEEHANELALGLRKDVNQWLGYNQERVSRGEMAILWILGGITILLFVVSTGNYFINNLIAISLSGVIIFTILKIRDYNYNRTGTEKALVEQDVLIQYGKKPYFPSRDMVLDGGYVRMMAKNTQIRIGDKGETERTQDLTPHVYVRYSLYILVALGIFILLALVYIKSGGLS